MNRYLKTVACWCAVGALALLAGVALTALVVWVLHTGLNVGGTILTLAALLWLARRPAVLLAGLLLGLRT